MSVRQARRGLQRRKHLINLLRGAGAATCDTTTASYTEGSGVGSLAIDSTAASHGMKSLKLTASSGGFPYMLFTNTTDGALVTAGNTYTLTVAVKVAAGTPAKMRATLKWYTAGGAFLSGSNGTGVAINSSGWTLVSVTATAVASAGIATPQVVADTTSWASSDAVWIDDFIICAGSTATPWSSP